ncbi:MAG: hypothetical protein IPG76_22645 [Acidobacteria bacterium]|nr:hypothetical protein [Acidobacteriota bacterium]
MDGAFSWERPVGLRKGDRIDVHLEAHLVGGSEYIYRWDTTVREGQTVKAEFRQSTFYGAPLSLGRLKKQNKDYVPELNLEGEIDRFILGMMGEGVSLGRIALELKERFPGEFRTEKDALTRAGELSVRYSK